VRVSLFWRNIFELNPEDREWPTVLVIPYWEAMGSFSPGAAIHERELFAPYLGNNKHTCAAFKVGINFDFVDTIEVGGEIGYNHFFKHDFDQMHVPNSQFQTNIYPFATDVSVKPGINWHFAGKIAAYHFLDKLSMYFQYVMMEHKKDHIELKNPDPAFVPQALEETTYFKAKVANIGFYYDISPNASLGFLWQAPLSQRNTYKSTTILFSFNAVV
jgi:hypothetical protein